MKETTRHGLGTRVIAAFCASALMMAAVLGIVMGSPLPALAADADQDIYAIFYENPDKKSYTLVIQNGDTVDTSYGKPANNGVVLICDETPSPAGSCGCIQMGYSRDPLLPYEYVGYTTKVMIKPGVKPHSLGGWFGGFGGLETIDLSGLDSSEVEDMERMFSGCASLKELDLSSLDTSRVLYFGGPNDGEGMFSGCSSLTSLDLSSFDMGQATAVGFLFSDCSSLESIKLPNSLTMKSVSDMSGVFSGCSSLKSIDISRFDTSKVTSMDYMFSGCSSLASIAFPTSFKTNLVESMYGMFSGCASLKSIDLSMFDTSRVKRVAGMFEKCSSLDSLDLSKFDTSKVTDMERMFNGCSSLKSIQFPVAFTTSWVTDMGKMFQGCSSLESIDLSKFDTSKVTSMDYMFSGCSSLASIAFPASFKTSLVESMYGMFSGCSLLETLDLSKFDMAKVDAAMSADRENYAICWMFTGCDSLFKVSLPAMGNFAKANLPDRRDGMKWGESLKWRNEKGEVFAADAIPACTAGTYTAVVVGSDSSGDSNGDGSGSGNGDGSGGNGDNSGSGNGNSGSNNGSNNGSGNGNGSGSANPAPKRTVAFSEAVALPLDATGVAMDKDDIIRDLAKRFGTREGFPADAEDVAVTIKHGGKEVEAIDPTRAGTYEVTAVYSMPDGAERVIEVAYTVADPAAKTPAKSAAKSGTRLAQTGDGVPTAVPAATAALAACALAAAVAVRRRARG